MKLAAILLIAVAASAETVPSTSGLIVAPAVQKLPDAPSRSLHAADYMRFAGIATYRALDWHTTTTGIRLGCREVTLPKSFAATPGGLAAFEFGAAAGQMGASTFLIHHGHRKLAETIDYLSIGAGMLVVSFNERAIHTAQSNRSTLVKE